MPLTKFQSQIALLLSVNRSTDSHLAGGAAIHLAPQSKRYSNDLDYFHDSAERVRSAFEQDRSTLEQADYRLEITLQAPGFVRAVVSKGQNSTKIEWSHDSAWRFFPVISNPEVGFQLHPIDLAINKLLAVAGRVEARDYYDILQLVETVLPLGALAWAAVGKDPGYTPQSLLEILRRRGKHQMADFDKLVITEPIDLVTMKSKWLLALDQAEKFIATRPLSECGCLYYSSTQMSFVMPMTAKEHTELKVAPHFGRPGGVLPNF